MFVSKNTTFVSNSTILFETMQFYLKTATSFFFPLILDLYYSNDDT